MASGTSAFPTPIIPGAAAFAWLGFLVFSVSIVVMLPQNDGALGPKVLIGWPNRFLMLAYSTWLITLAVTAHTRNSKP